MTLIENQDFQRPKTSIATTPDEPAPQGAPERHIPLRQRLSSKLLFMTVLAVLITEIIIIGPSIANMRNQWLSVKVEMVAAASLLLMEAYPETTLPPAIQDQLLRTSDALSITIIKDGIPRTIASAPDTPRIDQHIDLTAETPLRDLWGAVGTLIRGGDEIIELTGSAEQGDIAVDIVMSDNALHKRLVKSLRIITMISLLISIVAAALIYFIIHRLLLRPVGHMYENMFAFAQTPDDPTLIIENSCRKDELGYAQNRLSQMQTHLQRLFKERKHLADLGLAVSKINHDMRNILASAQLMSDSLADTKDPLVQRFSPKLIRTLNRAISYSETVIAYGRTQEPEPRRQQIKLHPLFQEVRELLTIPATETITFINMVPADFEVYIDKEQMLRVLTNLCQNSVQAMSAHNPAQPVEKILTVSAWAMGNHCHIAVADTGPGLPQKAKDNLFTAFSGSARHGGTGLGLVIALELVRSHGGNIKLREDYTSGALFEIRIPNKPLIPRS